MTLQATHLSIRLRSNIGLAFILTLTVLLYFRGLSGPFIFDDLSNIGPTVMTEWDLGRLLAIATANESGLLGRPISIISFSLTSLLLEPSPYAHKLVNLALHLVSGVLLYALLKTMFSTLLPNEANKSARLALWCSAIWLAHPLLVSTVLYSVQRMAMLSSLFMLSGMYLYLRGRLTKSTAGWLLVALSLFVALPLAIFSKENGVLLLLFLLLLEWAVIQPSESAAHKKEFWLFWTVFCAIAALAVLTVFAINSDLLLGSYVIRDFNVAERLYTQIEVMIFYFGQILAPGLVPLALFHDDFGIVRQPDLYTVACLVSLLTSMVLIVAGKLVHPIFRIGLAWFLAAHLIESTIIPLELVWEHRNYFAAIGPLMMLVLVVDAIAEKISVRVAKPLPLLVILISFCALTWARAGTWSDQHLLAQHLASTQPDSFRSQSFLAQTYAGNANLEQARNVLAEYTFRNPQKVEAYAQLIAYSCEQAEIANAALASLRTLLRTAVVSNYVMSDLSRLSLIASQGNCSAVTPQAVMDLLLTLAENPRLANDPTNYGILNFLLARNLLQLNQIEEALNQYDVAFATDQTTRPWRILMEKAAVLWRLGRYAEARDLRESMLAQFSTETGTLRFQDQLQALDQLMLDN